MRIGVLTRARDPLSIAGYVRHVVDELSRRDLQFCPVPEHGPAVDVDLLWDPGLGMRRVPRLLRRASLPVVTTVHGLLGFSLPARDIARSFADRARQALLIHRIRRDWTGFRDRVRRVITVSPYAADEARRALSLRDDLVEPILHGVDSEVFRADGARTERPRPYLLVVAQYQPKKNVDRIFAAYAGLPAADRPDLLAVIPGFRTRRPLPAGVELASSPQPPDELARHYRGALALVAPSLHETFGMPLAEAMACGCPVVTSDTTACPQVTADAALHVDPRSVDAIRTALQRIHGDAELRRRLSERGLARAARLTWQDSAARHAEVFRAAVDGGQR